MHEKVQIALKHLIPKQMERHGINEKEHLTFSEDAVYAILEGYTREAGLFCLFVCFNNIVINECM